MDKINKLFIVGGSRCGTTSLYSWMTQFDLLAFPPSKEEEHKTWHTDKLNLVCNPFYLVNADAPDWAHDNKIIMLTRDPIDRAYSHWSYLRSLLPNLEKSSFEAAINENFNRLGTMRCNIDCRMNSPTDYRSLPSIFKVKNYLESGLFYYHINRFSSMNKLCISIFDNPKLSLKKIAAFIGVSKYHEYLPHFNQGLMPRRMISKETVERITDFYQDDQTLLRKNYGC